MESSVLGNEVMVLSMRSDILATLLIGWWEAIAEAFGIYLYCQEPVERTPYLDFKRMVGWKSTGLLVED